MSRRLQNKALWMCIAILFGAGLTAFAASLELFVPTSAVLSLMVRAAALVAMLALSLWGFNMFGERCDVRQLPAARAINNSTPTNLMYRGIAVDVGRDGILSTSSPIFDAAQYATSESCVSSSGTIIIPVSIRGCSFRIVPSSKKRWVGQ